MRIFTYDTAQSVRQVSMFRTHFIPWRIGRRFLRNVVLIYQTTRRHIREYSNCYIVLYLEYKLAQLFTQALPVLSSKCLYRMRQQNVAIFTSSFWWIKLNIRYNYGMWVVKWHLMYDFYFLKITSPKWSAWHSTHSCNCDRKLSINS
jgi:hypothetical protein